MDKRNNRTEDSIVDTNIKNYDWLIIFYVLLGSLFLIISYSLAEPSTLPPVPPATNLTPQPNPSNAVPPKETNNTNSAASSPTTNSNGTTDNKSDNAKIIYPEWPTSIMLSDDNLKLIEAALDNYLNYKDSPVMANQPNNGLHSANPILDIVKLDVSPSFYLSSIIYHDPKDWTIWLNKNKIHSEEEVAKLKLIQPTLTLRDISGQEVIFEWKASGLEQLSPGWRKKLIRNPEKDEYISDQENIMIKEKEHLIIFKLRPHQSFSVYDMEVMEGYVPEKKLATNNPNDNTNNNLITKK